MRNTVFIHTNPKQAVGALVARHALIRNSAAPERFDVRIIDTGDFPAFARYEGRSYLREGKQAVWRNDDLQSFTPLRFAVPELMGYAGRAVLTDPDIFALADINLLLEPPGSVAPLEAEWNDFDRLTPETRLLHNTHRRTQPWKTGLPSDFTPRGTTLSSRAGIWLRRLRGKGAGSYRRHPDPAQERLFFTLLGECLANGSVPSALLETEIARGHSRTDAHDCIAQAKRAAA